MNPEPILFVDDLHVHFFTGAGPVCALNGLELRLFRGEILGLVGEASSGKSVAGLACLGIVRSPGEIVRGRVVYEGRDLLSLPATEADKIRGGEIALIPPNARAALHPMMTIGAQIGAVLRAHERVSRDTARTRALEMLGAVGISDPRRRFDVYPHELSGGMAQRIAVAMALICSPRVLIADEPTTGLDVTIQRQVLDLIAALVRDRGTTVLLMTRDLGIVAQYCQRITVLYGGLHVEESDTGTFFQIPAHPYSQHLLRSILDRRRREGNDTMRGVPPRFRELPIGCICESRCAWATDICRSEAPTWRSLERGHEVRCHWARRANGQVSVDA
jgi:peptide/nickel transport system ATP-binding protein